MKKHQRIMRRRGYAERAAMKKGYYVEEVYEDKIRKVKLTHFVVETILWTVIGFVAIFAIGTIYSALVSVI